MNELRSARTDLGNSPHHIRARTLNMNYNSKSKVNDIIRDLMNAENLDCFRSKSNCRCDYEIKYSYEKPSTHIHFSMGNSSTSASGSKGCEPIHTTKIIRYNLLKEYSKSIQYSNVENMEKILHNYSNHLVAMFKEYLIYDDINEFLHKYYNPSEAKPYLKKIFEYYSKMNTPMPSCAALNEKKALLKNGRKKERIRELKENESNDSKRGNISNLFCSKFMASLVNNDLQESQSYLPADSMLDNVNGEKGILDLLDKLTEIVSAKNADIEKTNKEKKSCILAKKMDAKNPNPTKTITRAITRQNLNYDKPEFRHTMTARLNKREDHSLNRNCSSRISHIKTQKSMNQIAKTLKKTHSYKNGLSHKTNEERKIPYVKICLSSNRKNSKPRYPKASINPRLISHTHAPSLKNGLMKGPSKNSLMKDVRNNSHERLITTERGRLNAKGMERVCMSTMKLVYKKL